MKIYKLLYAGSDSGNNISWHPSRAAAMGFFNKIAREITPEDVDQIYAGPEIYAISFQPNKKGILRLLEHHTPGKDNG